MGADELKELELAVNELDARQARRVGRLVLECRASLRDALAAVQMADIVAAERARVGQRQGARWRIPLNGLRQQHLKVR